MTILVSVIIPVLNNKQLFIICLESILSCKRKLINIEIIVIDGGSSDGTLTVIKEYEDDISYWETGKDSGISDAFNRGIKVATGDLIAILNSDDYWHDETLQYIEDAYLNFPSTDVFYGDLQFLDDSLDTFYIKKPEINKMRYRMNIFHPAMFVTRNGYEKVGLYRLDFVYAMDSEWCHRALKMNLKFEYIPHVLTTMRLGGVSDREFKHSLQEYRKSVIQHGLVKPWQAWAYYGYFLVMKMLMRVSYLRTLKYKIQNRE